MSLTHRALEISFSISTGNEAASGVEDFFEYVIGDPHTKVVAMIVEQFRQPARFLSLVRKARAAGKTVVLLHPGSSSAARASAATHTGAMTGDYLVMKTKVEHAGVVMVETIEELVDVSDILVRCHSLPKAGAAVFTESGAFKALTLDLCETLGLQLPSPSDETSAGLRAALPDFIPPTNPLDLTAQGLIDPGLYRRTLPIVLADERFGSVVLAIILTDEATSGRKLPPILEAIRETKPTKPLVFAGLDEGAGIDPAYVEQLRDLGVPFFPTPSRAFRALARLTAFASAMKRTFGAPVEIGAAAAPEPGVIPEYRSKRILASLGIPVPDGGLATTPSQARAIAERIGYPVVLKAQASALSHKSDAGGVALNIGDVAGARRCLGQMHAVSPSTAATRARRNSGGEGGRAWNRDYRGRAQRSRMGRGSAGGLRRRGCGGDAGCPPACPGAAGGRDRRGVVPSTQRPLAPRIPGSARRWTRWPSRGSWPGWAGSC